MRISERGQITVPKALRERLGMHHNIEVEITLTEQDCSSVSAALPFTRSTRYAESSGRMPWARASVSTITLNVTPSLDPCKTCLIVTPTTPTGGAERRHPGRHNPSGGAQMEGAPCRETHRYRESLISPAGTAAVRSQKAVSDSDPSGCLDHPQHAATTRAGALERHRAPMRVEAPNRLGRRSACRLMAKWQRRWARME